MLRIKIKDESMEHKFYYLRAIGYGRHPVITVCLVKNGDGIISRGVAICSVDDNFIKKKGRDLSSARAKKANGTHSDHEKHLIKFYRSRRDSINRMETVLILNSMTFKDIGYLYQYDIKPTEFESKLFKKWGNQEKTWLNANV